MMDVSRFRLGLLILAIGIAWPLLAKFGFGRLPGDIVIQRENSTIYIPIVTSLLISLVLTAALNLVWWLSSR
jgi:hypothetical protein